MTTRLCCLDHHGHDTPAAPGVDLCHGHLDTEMGSAHFWVIADRLHTPDRCEPLSVPAVDRFIRGVAA